VSAAVWAMGIYFILSDGATALDNVVSTANYGIYFNSSSGKYLGNLTNNIATAAFTGGTPVGTND